MKNIYQQCVEDNIPLIGITEYSGNINCSACQRLKRFLEGNEFNGWLKDNKKYMVIEGDMSRSQSEYDYVKELRNTIVDRTFGNYFAGIFFYWKKPDGTEVSKDCNGEGFNTSKVL